MAKRRIIFVTLDAREAIEFFERATQHGRHRNVKQHHEKIRSESTWRWGWVIVADAEVSSTG